MKNKIHCYDNNGETFDRYTVVFLDKIDGEYIYLAMSENPANPLGFCQHGFSPRLIDEPKHMHLGKRISFDDLPEDCRKQVLNDLSLIYETNN
jgi:hypothetical protein